MIKKHIRLLPDIIKFLLVTAALIWVMNRGIERLDYHWQWYRIPRYIFTYENGVFTPGPLIEGLLVTFHITGVSMGLMLVLGLLTAIFRLSDSFLAKTIARIYLELIRNTPLLVQLFFIYFVLAPVLDINRFSSAVLALSLFEGAYASEIFRAGILSVHTGQQEAAKSLGMNTFQTYVYIILPQAIPRMLPPLTGQGVSLIKDSALVSVIAVYDLTMRGRMIIADTYLTFEMWFTIAGIYLMITITLSFGVSLMEKRFRG